MYRELPKTLMTNVLTIGLGAIIGSCTARDDQHIDHVESHNMKRESETSVATRNEMVAELREETRRLRDATEELNESASAIMELATEFVDIGSTTLIPDESVCLEFEASGMSKYVTVDSSGRGVRSDDSRSAGNVQVAPDQLLTLFARLKRIERDVAIDESMGCRIVAIQMPAPENGMQLTYHRQSGRKRISIRCTNKKGAIASNDCNEVVRLLYNLDE